MAKKNSGGEANGATDNLGFEAKLWLTDASEGEKTHHSVDLLGRVYGYSLTRSAIAALPERLRDALRPGFTLPPHA